MAVQARAADKTCLVCQRNPRQSLKQWLVSKMHFRKYPHLEDPSFAGVICRFTPHLYRTPKRAGLLLQEIQEAD
jgi:hypothetical protein